MTSPNKCVVVFSGGTDSTCVASLMAKKYDEIHLLTFFEEGTKDEPFLIDNVNKLKKKYPSVKFKHYVCSTDNLVRLISYNKYFYFFRKFGLLNMATPSFSSISWHIRTMAYCLDNDIKHVVDGLTNELVQLPGHMSGVIEVFRGTYQKFNINYQNPVRDWEIPEDQQFLDRIIVDQHGFFFPSEEKDKPERTTGQYLFDEGIFPHPNIKGSKYDQQMQHDCYQFVLYNILAFWFYLNFMSYEKFMQKVSHFVAAKIEFLIPFLNDPKRSSLKCFQKFEEVNS
jgi:hypothetical protein